MQYIAKRFKYVRIYGGIFFAIALFGYPIVGNFVSWFDIDSRILSIPFRIFVGFFSILTIVVARDLRLDKWRLFMLFIWIALILRLAFDISIAEIETAEYALQFFLISCVLPAVAIWSLNAYSQKYYALAGFIVAATGSLIALLGNNYGVFGESDLTEITGRLSSVALNPVSLGHLAVSGFICGLEMMQTVKYRTRAVLMIIMLALIVIVVETGSKGPVVALLITLLIWMRQRGLNTLLIGVTIPVVIAVSVYFDNPLSQRLSTVDNDISTIDRIAFVNDSIQQIANSPWIGSASVELKSGSHPHNIFLESGLSFGLPLTVVLAVLLGYGLFKSFSMLKYEHYLVPLLFIQALVISQISGALFADSMLWICLVLILGSKVYKNEEK